MKDLTFLSSTIPGTQQIRLEIGHALFGARVEFGDPLFLTISPSSRRSGLCMPFSRYRSNDPALLHERSSSSSVPAWVGRTQPRLWECDGGDKISMQVPPYAVRRIMTARDPWCVMQNFEFSVKYLLPRLLGLRQCIECPNCNRCGSSGACANAFGHNMAPVGGTFGLAMASGGSVEYQGINDPHFHGNVHLVTVYQDKTIAEIADMMQANLLTLDDVTTYQSWVCREDFIIAFVIVIRVSFRLVTRVLAEPCFLKHARRLFDSRFLFAASRQRCCASCWLVTLVLTVRCSLSPAPICSYVVHHLYERCNSLDVARLMYLNV